MNLKEAFLQGQQGANKGLSMGKGLPNVNKAVNGVQRQRFYGVAGSPKSGKSTFADYAFVLSPYLDSLSTEEPLIIRYYSFELNRVSKEFDFAAFFLWYDYNIEKVKLPEDVTLTQHGLKVLEIDLSPDFLRGRVLDDNEQIIKVPQEIVEKLILVYKNRIIPLFGEYDDKGEKISNGIIEFIEEKNNPTGLYKDWLSFAEKIGKFETKDYGGTIRLLGYTLHNPNLRVIIVIDHLRKVLLERGFDLKKAVDKTSEYITSVRDKCGFTFVGIIHTNRNIASIESLKHYGDEIYPTSDSLKDTGGKYMLKSFVVSKLGFIFAQ